MQKIKIAYVIGSMGNARAGTEKNLLTLIEHLDRANFEPLLISLQDCEYIQSQKYVCDTRCLQLYRMFMPEMFRKRRELAAEFQQQEVDIVQTFFTEAHLVGGGAAQIAQMKAIISSRRNLGYSYGFREKVYLSLANRHPLRWLANSKAVAEAISTAEGIPRDRIDVIYNGVEPGPGPGESSADKGTLRVMLVANLRPVKSVETLLQAAPAIIKQIPKTRFEIIGEGSDRPRLEQLASQLGVGDQVLFHGSRADVDQLLNGGAVGVLTSTSEGFSNSILEYMRAALPVVATAVGGNKEVVRDGETGLLIPPRDPEALSQKLIQLLTDSALRTRMGAAGRQLLEQRFSLKQMIAAHQDYYQRLLANLKDNS